VKRHRSSTLKKLSVMLSSVAVRRSAVSRSRRSRSRTAPSDHHSSAARTPVSTSTSRAVPRPVLTSPTSWALTLSHPSKTGTTSSRGNARRASSPAPPWSMSMRIGSRAGWCRMTPTDAAMMKVEVCRAMIVKYGRANSWSTPYR
jgi:hypothetical protein